MNIWHYLYNLGAFQQEAPLGLLTALYGRAHSAVKQIYHRYGQKERFVCVCVPKGLCVCVLKQCSIN